MDNSITNDTGETKFSGLFAIFCIWSYTLFSRPQDIFQFLEPLRPALVFGLLCVATFFLNKTTIDEEVFVHKTSPIIRRHACGHGLKYLIFFI